MATTKLNIIRKENAGFITLGKNNRNFPGL